MRIDAYMQVSQLYNTNKPKKTLATGETSMGTDTLEISDFAKQYQIAKEAMKNAPDVREDKVALIQQQLADGTYHVSAEKLAEKLANKLVD